MATRWAENDKRAYLASFDAIVGWGVQDKLSRITCPTLVISADRDYTPVTVKQAYVALIPGAKLIVIKNSRHATPLDQADEFNRTVLEFIDAVPV
jgi:3-oxoadipate enol-lactonase